MKISIKICNIEELMGSGVNKSKGILIMQEILTVMTYLAVWLICRKVVGIQSGFVTLIISLGAAVSVYVIFAAKQYEGRKNDDK
ncbi:MAG: hypothetical protein J7K35_08320 [Syntrophobacterales bacterium]|nr:hypothetical protein [Syntrophobacterales bacterium]